MSAATTTNNVAQGNATVGVQAQAIHIDARNYQLSPDAPPEQRFRVGVEYLDARIPDEARRHIEEAVARGYETDEVRFHLLLALLSGRTLRQLGNDDLNRLAVIYDRISRLSGDGEWTAGLRTVLRLLSSLQTADKELVVKELDELGPRQRDKILDHLGVLLEGPIEEQLWRRVVERARREQMAGNRADRIWMFFHPTPIPPRVRAVQPASVSAGDRLRAVLGSVAVTVAVGEIGWLVLRRGQFLPVLAYLVAVAGIAAVMHGGADRHFRRERLRTVESRFVPPRQRQAAPADGFAGKVDRLFDRYFGRYVPRETDRVYWLEQTAGIRRHLRDEVVELYREERIDDERIAWLVRHLVGEVRKGWERNTLLAHRAELRVPTRSTALYWGGLLAIAVAGFWVVPAAVRTEPATGTGWVLLAVACGVPLARAWFRGISERRRVAADEIELAEEYARRQAAFQRWRRKLADKPSDAEMAAWLECDRRILVDQTLQHYRLRASQVIAHAFIEAPATSYKRGKVPRGPWRYSKYRLLLFLLTDDGVRQVDIDLDFQKASASRTQRLNYRFEAVAAVRIHGTASQQQTFELTLVNGEPISVRVAEVDAASSSGEDPWTLSQVTMDASGLAHTLNVLEGIAAEGKEWIRHQRRRADERLIDLTATVRGLLG